MMDGSDGITELDKMDYVDSSGVHEEPEPNPGKRETYLSLESQVLTFLSGYWHGIKSISVFSEKAT